MKQECKQCKRFRDNACVGTDYFSTQEHYYCIADWEKFKRFDIGTRFMIQKKPRFWMIENPQGCLRHFIGRPQYCIRYGDFGHYCQKPTDLWGVLPFFQAMKPNTVIKGHHNVTAYTNGTRRADQRALLPYNLSLTLCLAIEDAYDSFPR